MSMAAKTLCAVMFALGVGACTAGVLPALDDTCPRAQFQDTIGKPIADVAFPLTVDHRIIGPTDAVSADHLPERLNIKTDAQARIVDLSCG